MLVPITSIDDPRVQDYRAVKARQVRVGPGDAARDRSGEFQNGTFLAEGELVVRLLTRSRFRTRSVLLTPSRLETLRSDLDSLPPETPIYVADQAVMSGVVGFDIHRGVLAAAERGELCTLPDLLKSRPRGLVLLEELANADNVGAIFRNCAALAPGFAVVQSPGCCDPLYRKAIRVSVGHILNVPFSLTDEWPQAIAAIKQAGYTLVALTTGPGSIPIAELNPASHPGPFALLVGTEGAGVSEQARALADVRVVIPMASGVDSLNVGVATAIALHRLGGL